MNLGKIKHYEEYEVYDETDTKFSLKINDYIKMGKVFALMLKIDVQSISKIAPIYTYSYKCENVMDFFIEPYKGAVDINFSDYEKNAIIEPLMADSHEYNVVATICNAYYVFKYDDLDSLVEKISQMTKSQMILAEYSIQRGNHIQNKDNLKRKIDKLFM